MSKTKEKDVSSSFTCFWPILDDGLKEKIMKPSRHHRQRAERERECGVCVCVREREREWGGERECEYDGI